MLTTRIPHRYTHCMAAFMPVDEWQYADVLVDLAAQSTSLFGSDTGVCRSEQQHLCASRLAGHQCSAQDTALQEQPQQPAGTRSDASRVADLSSAKKKEKRQQEQCGHQVLMMPAWLKQLAQRLSGAILCQPNTFRQA